MRLPSLLHPASGLLLLAIDWLLFTGGLLTLGLSTPFLLWVSSLVTGGGIVWIQSRYTADRRLAQLGKGLVGALLVAVPLPIAGTAAGGLILALSGLRNSDESPGRVDAPSQSPPDSLE